MEPQGVFVLSEPGLVVVVGPNNMLRHTICHRFAMLLSCTEQYAPHQYARAYNMLPQGLYNGLIFSLIIPSVIVQRATNEANYPWSPGQLWAMH